MIKEVSKNNTQAEATNEKYEVLILFDTPVLFTNERIKRGDFPKDLFYYDLRYDDSVDGEIVELKDRVLVNHMSTIICKEDFNKILSGRKKASTKDGIDVDLDDYGYTGDELTIDEYREKYDTFVDDYFAELEGVESAQ